MNREVPAHKVSRNAKIESKCDGRTGMLMVRSSGNVTEINCGWTKVHERTKVREDSAEKHLTTHHYGGNAIWL